MCVQLTIKHPKQSIRPFAIRSFTGIGNMLPFAAKFIKGESVPNNVMNVL